MSPAPSATDGEEPASSPQKPAAKRARKQAPRDASAAKTAPEGPSTSIGSPATTDQGQTDEGDSQEPLVPAELSFQQARTALDLMIAELQSSDLQVEEMLNLYRRAEAYADHCEAVLQRVDQDVIEWDVLQKTRESVS